MTRAKHSEVSIGFGALPLPALGARLMPGSEGRNSRALARTLTSASFKSGFESCTREGNEAHDYDSTIRRELWRWTLRCSEAARTNLHPRERPDQRSPRPMLRRA